MKTWKKDITGTIALLGRLNDPEYWKTGKEGKAVTAHHRKSNRKP